MTAIIPYLFFNGNCREAMSFYKDCLGGHLEIMTYADAPEGAMETTAASATKIMHSFLKNDHFTLMASDWPEGGANFGNNVHLSLDFQTVEELEKIFDKLSQNGKITQPLSDTFWGARFGMLVDQFGIHWMFNHDYKK